MSAAPAVIVDVLNSLLEAEQDSIIRFLGPGSPYLTTATAKLRDDLAVMAAATDRRSAGIAGTVDRLGGVSLPRKPQPAEQYLAYLSLKFLLPKLVDAEQLLIDRYDNALNLLDPNGTPTVVLGMLKTFRLEHIEQQAAIQKAADEVLPGRS
jgi:hypothetical protein